MVYSTCSFNPVENEAVVAAPRGRCGGAVEIVDASDRVRGLRRRAGMTTWKVLTAEDEGAMTEWKTSSKTRVGKTRRFPPGCAERSRAPCSPQGFEGDQAGQAHQGPAPGAVHAARAARPGHGRRKRCSEVGPIPGVGRRRGAARRRRCRKRTRRRPGRPTADDDADAQDARVRARANRRASRFERGVGHRHDRHVSFRPRRERDTGVVDVLRAGRQGAVYGGGGRVTGEVRLGRRARLRKARRGCGRVETRRRPVKRVGAGSSSSDLGENVTKENVPEEERVTAASFGVAVPLDARRRLGVGARARPILRAGRPLRGDAEPTSRSCFRVSGATCLSST